MKRTLSAVVLACLVACGSAEPASTPPSPPTANTTPTPTAPRPMADTPPQAPGTAKGAAATPDAPTTAAPPADEPAAQKPPRRNEEPARAPATPSPALPKSAETPVDAPAAKPTASPAADRRGPIVFLGDSHMARGQWKRAFGSLGEVVNHGKGWDQTANVRARLQRTLELGPSTVVLMIGINDLAKGKSSEHVRAGIAAILSRLTAATPRPRVIVTSVLPIDFDRYKVKGGAGTLPPLNQQIAAVARSKGAKFVNLYPSFADARGYLRTELSADGVHITPKGYAIWERKLRPLLK